MKKEGGSRCNGIGCMACLMKPIANNERARFAAVQQAQIWNRSAPFEFQQKFSSHLKGRTPSIIADIKAPHSPLVKTYRRVSEHSGSAHGVCGLATSLALALWSLATPAARGETVNKSRRTLKRQVEIFPPITDYRLQHPKRVNLLRPTLLGRDTCFQGSWGSLSSHDHTEIL